MTAIVGITNGTTVITGRITHHLLLPGLGRGRVDRPVLEIGGAVLSSAAVPLKVSKRDDVALGLVARDDGREPCLSLKTSGPTKENKIKNPVHCATQQMKLLAEQYVWEARERVDGEGHPLCGPNGKDSAWDAMHKTV